MRTALVYSSQLDAYSLSERHPLRPERVALAVELMSGYGLVHPGLLEPVMPRIAARSELLLAHSAEYIDAVVQAGAAPGEWPGGWGIDLGDTPPFAGMHEAAAFIAGATTRALECVLDGDYARAFSPSGGLHHAHASRAAGFCVYNDVAVAIKVALNGRPSLRVFYLDIDAHHGDGVQEAFYTDPRVCTLSLHESGRYLFPGTGFPGERGEGAGLGYSLNVPLPPGATDECYALVFDEVVQPVMRAFAPDIIVAQCGADAHHADPLTELGLSIPGYRSLFGPIVSLADELCEGRIVATGGGGYAWATNVPRIWTLLAAALAGMDLPERLPEAWRVRLRELGFTPPGGLTEETGIDLDPETSGSLVVETRRTVAAVLTGALPGAGPWARPVPPIAAR